MRGNNVSNNCAVAEVESFRGNFRKFCGTMRSLAALKSEEGEVLGRF
jgi:hypothetical protein